ncbi:LacI family DNA-binding transcriptional regulator [Desertihabitans aurantiacus]|uniref:LacI family DNA-binding transcriptional regulator n=1 Tax=Desertihabitans aurantiacus TaxID=2282477 RepID=UPI000DF7DA40|nr:LacI family DNA-binding transcriptional regulator [Desertihabitans aurantiacus]
MSSGVRPAADRPEVVGATTRLEDVARALGVSGATVSRALSGKPGVSREMAERVRRTAAEMGYVANVHARTLAGGPTSVLGLVVHDIIDPYFTEIAAAMVDAAEEHGLLVQVCHAGRDPERELKQVRTLVAHHVRAIVLAGSGHLDPALEQPTAQVLQGFAARGGQVAVIGRRGLKADAVLPDNVGAGATIARHLLRLGHRRIVVLGGLGGLTTVQDRIAGLASVLDADPDVTWHLEPCEFSVDGATTATATALDAHPDTTALVTLSDQMATGALDVLRRRGLRVPDDLSVTGFDDIRIAAQLSPGLTTVRFPLTEMGRKAFDLVLRPHAGRPRRRTVSSVLVPRDSTAAPNPRR